MTFNQNKLTEKAQEALVAAQRLAEERHYTQLEPEHLLAALVSQEGGVVPAVLARLDVKPAALLTQLDAILAGMARVGTPTQVYVSPRFRGLLDAAQAEAERLKDEYVSTEHLFLAIAAEGGKSPASRLLQQRGITKDTILQALTAVRGSQRVTSQNPESTYQSLERYGRDLTELARKGKLDPVIGRDDEIRRVIQVLSRRTKNNPVLIGEPGVGKTAIVEGLALRIVNDDVPEGLRHKKIVALEVLAVLVERRRADRVELAAGEHGLQHVRRVDRPFGGSRADDGVELVDEQDHLAGCVGDFLQDGLQPLLELAAVLRAGDERT